MVLRLALLAWLGCLVAAGPVTWDDSKCAQKCLGRTKYQYSEQTSYIYSYESSNEIIGDVAAPPDLSMGMKATVKLTAISKCEMVLQITDATLQHGPLQETSSAFIDELKRNPLPFSWNDGHIEHVCPSPDDSDEANNVKKGILSALQNTMKSFEVDWFEKEVDVLGSCDTSYKVKSNKNEKYVIMKDKNIPTCTDHLKHKTIVLASFYESSSQRQHLPLFSGEHLSCRQTIDHGVVEEVTCEEIASFKPLTTYAFDVGTKGKVVLQKLSSEPATRIMYRTPEKDSLVYSYHPETRKNENVEEVKNVLKHICANSEGIITKEAANYVHKLVYLIRGLSEESLEGIYNSLKNKELCQTKKPLTIFQDSLKAANSGGSIELFSKLIKNGEIRKLDEFLWLTLMPFSSYVEEASIAAAVPLLKKDSANKQALLGVTAMAYKYCAERGTCKDSAAVKEVSSSLKQFLGDKCQNTNQKEANQIITALKAFGNLGYVGESAEAILECANLATNTIPVRISAIEALRRTPCTEEIVSKILDIYKNKNEEDEVRMAALISLGRCSTMEVMRQINEAYESETSKQVEVFTWSYLENYKSTFNPIKSRFDNELWFSDKKPSSTDITKFSRNFQSSIFSELLNIGHDLEANIIHSKKSFLPRSADLGLKVDYFGNELDLFKIGGRFEDLEHVLERLFGPRGWLPNLMVDGVSDDVYSFLNYTQFGKRMKRSVDSYKSKIEALSERLSYSRGKAPHGNAYIRVLGHELGWLHFDKDMFADCEMPDIDGYIRTLVNTKVIDGSKNLLFLDMAILVPSVTGRAYKLALNGSLTLGLNTAGKIEIEKDTYHVNLEGNSHPSLLSEIAASITIHSENYEPGIKVETTLQSGLDLEGKLEVKGLRLLHLKVQRQQKKHEFLSLKRSITALNHEGVLKSPKAESYHFDYCTKYVQTILGSRYCTSATIPHFYDGRGKLKIPFLREFEASVTVEETDSKNGYELLLQLPEAGATQERHYKFLLDTPGSATDRRISIEATAKEPTAETGSLELRLHNPFYNLDVDVDCTHKEDLYKLNVEALANKKRRYSLLLDVGIDTKGARLVEYSPKISVSVPKLRPVEMSGKVVYSRGRKDQLTINLQSTSFDDPINIKGLLVKDGKNEIRERIALGKHWEVHSEFNVTAFSQIHRLESSIGSQPGKGIFMNLGHHYEPDGRSYESITVSSRLDNINFNDRLKFSLESKILLADHQDLNSLLKWDFDLKPFAHVKNDVIFRYGENFEDDKHVVRITQAVGLHGDFDSLRKMHLENKLGLTISCFDFDKSIGLNAKWDFLDKLVLILEGGIKSRKEQEISFLYDYRHISSQPLKMVAEGKFVYDTYKILYHDQFQEMAPNEYQGKAVIEPAPDKQITVDYIVKYKTHDLEFDGTINFPGRSVPTVVKAALSYSSTTLKFNGIIDNGDQSPITLDVKLQRIGGSEISLNTPLIEGNVAVNSVADTHSITADVTSKLNEDHRVKITGSVARGDISTLTLDIFWDADKDTEKKISIKAETHRATEDGIEKRMLTASISYIGTIDVAVTGKLSTDFFRGPHYFRADFSGKMDPMAIEFTHSIHDGHATSVIKYIKKGDEKVRLDMKGKLILPGNTFEVEYGLFVSSPYKALDGKELYFRIMADSNEATRVFISEYRIISQAGMGYVGKIDYERKRGIPGQIKSNLLATVHQRPIYEGHTVIDYGNGKYTWRSSFTPVSKRKINLLTSFEHAGKFAAFHHSMASTLKYLQKVELNVVADLRDLEDAKVHSNFDINDHQLYDVNSTLRMKSIIDFDGQLVIFSRITPTLKVFSKAQTSGQVTAYEANLEIDSVNLITGSGEIKKRKKSFNGNMIFKYKEKELLALTLSQESKSKTERNYTVKAKTPWRSYQSSVRIVREGKGDVRYETNFCRAETDKCISIDAHHKEVGDVDEWQIAYKRGEVDFSVERIRVNTKDLQRFHTVIYKGDNRYGYDLKLAREDHGHSISLGIVLPSRKIVTKTYAEISLQNPRLKFEFSLDERKHPDRKFVTDIRFENHLTDNKPSKLNVIISHPIYEKPIELQFTGDYEPNSNKFFTAVMSADYTNDPEDKLIGKLSLEQEKDETKTAILNIYHQDDQHLDFVVKLNATSNHHQNYVGLFYDWKDDESNADQHAFMLFQSLQKERKILFEYSRPKLHYRLDGVENSPETLLGEESEMELTSLYNGETTKGKLVLNERTHCGKLFIFNDEGETTRTVELCMNSKSREIISILMEGLDDENEWTFDFSGKIIRKSWRTISFQSHFNPEFLGSFLFKMTALGDELSSAGLGSIPIYNTARFKKIRTAFHSKIYQPSLFFIIKEAAKLITDMRKDSIYLSTTLDKYYNSLPPLLEVKENAQKAAEFIRHVLEEAWSNVESYYTEYFKELIAFVEKSTGIVKQMCDKNEDCQALVKAYNEGGLKELEKEILRILRHLPERIEALISNSGPEARKLFDRVMTIVKHVLEPLTKYECGEIVVKIVQLIYQKLEPHIQTFLEEFPGYYKKAKQEILSNKYVIQSRNLVEDTYLTVRNEVKKIDFEKLYAVARHHIEDYLLNFSPPTPKSGFTKNAFDTEKGVVDLDFHFGFARSYIFHVVGEIIDQLEDVVDNFRHNGWNTILVKVKRAAHFDFFPPYHGEAMIVGNQHFVTFDNVFYDFAGECSYLLSRDFEDGNFTFALQPKEGDKGASILALINDISVELDTHGKKVSVADHPVELPYISEEFSVSLHGSTIVVDDKHGVSVECSLVHEICTFRISGWYFGKTAGLLGTYNYEQYDEFKRPKGQIANSAGTMAKSWELKKGCKSANLVQDVKINENSDYYRLCKAHFEDSTSPLSACFYEVNPKEYFQLCLRHLARASDSTKALCNVASAYVTECENNYIELNLPGKCLICSAPDGSTMQHGDKKKYEHLNKKSADVIFIVEDHECNKAVVGELGNLARSIERELQNDAFKDTMFGVVGYGGSVGDPEVYTVHGNTFFNSRDINEIKDRLKLESKKAGSSKAFEAMKLATKYLFRSDAAKTFVLLSCSACKYDYKSLHYPVVQQILLERGISLHVINSAAITIRKGKEKDIIGADPDTVYHSKDVTQQDLIGEPALRSQVVLPKDLCIALSQDVDGSFFSTAPLIKASSLEAKNWRSVFARKFLKSVQSFQCQWCDCTSTRDHVPNTVCQPCESKRPRLPFSVCKSCPIPRTVESFLSYILHFVTK